MRRAARAFRHAAHQARLGVGEARVDRQPGQRSGPIEVAARAAIDVFEPQAEPLAALTLRVKQAFDPKGVLEPGRMFKGV